MRVEQRADGTYQKVFTETEIELIRSIMIERKNREADVQHLQERINALEMELNGLKQRVTALEVS